MQYGRTLLLSAILVALALLTTWKVRPGSVDSESPPMDQVLEAVTEAELETVAGSPDVLEIIRPEWDLPVTRNDRVEFWIDFLVGRNRDHTRLWLERSGRYVPMIRGELRARRMPEDLIYLAMIESGFSPRAYSSAHASGLWQFIAETGRRYGLEISQHVDERRDPVKSTIAALDYLADLHNRFGSWYLAAAAYNSGEQRVEQVLRQRAGGRRGDDALFWRIAPHLPRETRDFVPLMLAAGHVAKEPEKYGFLDIEYHPPLRFDTVHAPGATTLRVIARAAEAEEQLLQDLNPHLVRGSTPPGRTYAVRVPLGHDRLFAQNLARVLEEERVLALAAAPAPVAAATHIVRRGETLSHIARRYGVSVHTIQRANSVRDPRRLQIGERLRIPGGNAAVVASAGAAGMWQVHRVRRGDSLWAIARRYNVTVRQLQAWNNLGSRSLIRPGQRIRVRAA